MNGSLARRCRFGLSGAWLLLCLAAPGLVKAETLTLGQALELAFDRSPAMLQARHSLEISRRNLQAQQAALKSRFSLTLTPYQFSKDRIFNDLVSQYNTQEQTYLGATFSIHQPIERTDGTLSVIETFGWREASSSFASSFTGSRREQTYDNSLFLRYSHPLFTYNRTRLQLEELELALENARLNHAIQKLQIENQVTRLFYDLYYKQESVRIAAEELENASTSFAIIEDKVRAGLAAEEQFFQADLDRASRRASLNNARLQLAKLDILAPFDGVLVDLVHYNRDQFLEAGAPLGRLMDYSRLYAEIALPGTQLGRVVPGQKALITPVTGEYAADRTRYDRSTSTSSSFSRIPDAGETANGYERGSTALVTAVSPVIDRDSRTFKATLSIANDSLRIRPGMFVKVEIVTASRDSALVIPRDAVIDRGDSKVVFVVEKGIALERKLETGLGNPTSVEVLSGLEEEERLVVEGFETLRSRAKVKVGK